MLRFYAGNFTAAVCNLQTAKDHVIYADGQEQRSELANCLAYIYNELFHLPVSSSLRKQVQRVMESAEDADQTMLITRVIEVQANLAAELGEQVFLWIRPEEVHFYREPANWFGDVVTLQFPEARWDMRDSLRCLALNLWTAAVYHAMCVVQHGLHRLAERLSVQFAREIDVLNWNEILTRIEATLKQLRNQPKTPALDVQIKWAARAATQFFVIREAWRNYVMHGRERYDEEEAKAVVTAVRDIMRAVAAHS